MAGAGGVGSFAVLVVWGLWPWEQPYSLFEDVVAP
jgi:hypothetical protein